MNCFGTYHEYITKKYDETEKYYMMAIENGNSDAMCNLGSYHKYITKNYKLMDYYHYF